MTRIDVAIGIVLHQGRVLICQRRNHGAFAGFWEFPGGKCEAGESPLQCVVRELREELGVDVKPVANLTILEHDYPTLQVRLHPFLCHLDCGDPLPLESQCIEWTDGSALRRYTFPDANGPLVQEVISLLSPASPTRSDAGSVDQETGAPRPATSGDAEAQDARR